MSVESLCTHKTKEYKVKWQDYREETWIDHTAIEKTCQRWLDYKKIQAQSVASIATLAADLICK